MSNPIKDDMSEEKDFTPKDQSQTGTCKTTVDIVEGIMDALDGKQLHDGLTLLNISLVGALAKLLHREPEVIQRKILQHFSFKILSLYENYLETKRNAIGSQDNAI